MITTELPSESVQRNSGSSRCSLREGRYLGVCSFERRRSVGLCLLDTVLVRLARLIVILSGLEAMMGRAYGMIL